MKRQYARVIKNVKTGEETKVIKERKERSDKGKPRKGPLPGLHGPQNKRVMNTICNPVKEEPGAYQWRTETHLWRWIGGPRDNFGPVIDGKLIKIENAMNLALAVMFSYGWDYAYRTGSKFKGEDPKSHVQVEPLPAT